MDQIAFFLPQHAPTWLDVVATPVLIFALGWLSVVDAKEFRLPDMGTIPLIAAGVFLAALRIRDIPGDALLGAFIGFGLFAAIGGFYFKKRGIEALGLGDAKLLAAAGAWLGWQALPLIILIASLFGILLAVIRSQDVGGATPFGPPLALAFILLWLAFCGPFVRFVF